MARLVWRLTPVQQELAEKVFALPAKQLAEESAERKDTGTHDERAHEGAVEERPQASAAEVDAAASKPAALVLYHNALSACCTMLGRLAMLGRQWVRPCHCPCHSYATGDSRRARRQSTAGFEALPRYKPLRLCDPTPGRWGEVLTVCV